MSRQGLEKIFEAIRADGMPEPRGLPDHMQRALELIAVGREDGLPRQLCLLSSAVALGGDLEEEQLQKSQSVDVNLGGIIVGGN